MIYAHLSVYASLLYDLLSNPLTNYGLYLLDYSIENLDKIYIYSLSVIDSGI